jgi:hypothetical protein
MSSDELIDNLVKNMEQTNAGEIIEKIIFNRNGKTYKFEIHIEEVTEEEDG